VKMGKMDTTGVTAPLFNDNWDIDREDITDCRNFECTGWCGTILCLMLTLKALSNVVQGGFRLKKDFFKYFVELRARSTT
jgi:hypothetical protein